jgi:hypothetical protein
VFFRPSLFGLPTCSFGASSNFSTNYFVGGSVSFFIELIGPTTYLRSLALFALIFVARFLSNYCLFLLEVISAKNSKVLVYSPSKPN